MEDSYGWVGGSVAGSGWIAVVAKWQCGSHDSCDSSCVDVAINVAVWQCGWVTVSG
jgi:hypothetical protein